MKVYDNAGNIAIVHLSRPRRKDREKMEEKNALTPEQRAVILDALNDPQKREALLTFLKNEERRLAELRHSQASQ